MPSLLTFARDERLVFVGVTAATVGLLVGMQALLRRFRDASEIKPIQPKTQYITQETEDALPMTTLDSLLDHYNFSIRETAAKIVCDRAVNDDQTLRLLLWGIGRPDYEERMKNLRALAMLTDQNSLYLLNTPVAYTAFVRSLEHCVGETQYDMLEDVYFDEYYLRDIAEKLCLMFLAQLTAKFDVADLVRAKFVERWLAKQRWGPEGDVQKRINNFSRYLQCRDNRIADICRRLRESPAGRAALEDAKLLPRWRDRDRDRRERRERRRQQQQQQQQQQEQEQEQENQEGGVPLPSPTTSLALSTSALSVAAAAAQQEDEQRQMAAEGEYDEDGGREGREGRHVLGVLDGGGNSVVGAGAHIPRQPRPPSQNTQEEQRIRRQHREAMVLNDGTRPLRRADIIERESD